MNNKIKIKVCGLTRAEDAALALELGAWALGFIFYRKSERYVDPIQVSKIAGHLEIKKVGVFVNATVAEIVEVATISKINTVQLHGEEDALFVAALHREVPQHKIIKAVRLKQTAQIENLKSFKNCEAFLVDSFVSGLHGGTGKVSDWDLAGHVSELGPLILSGGLTSENVVKAIREVKPFAIDVSSGVEAQPGVKSQEKMRLFFSRAHGEKK